MSTIVIVLMILVLTILAFVLKQWILHTVGIVGWLIATYLLFNLPWPATNTYMPTAVTFFGFTMVIVHTVMLIIILVGERPQRLTYDDEKEENKKAIYRLTRRKEKRWYE